MRYTPLATRAHHRMGARERAVETAEHYPDRLRIELDALVTRVILDADNRATGVEYLKGSRSIVPMASRRPGRARRCKPPRRAK